MKTALIIGITGNFGGQMGQTLHHRGWKIKALTRVASKAPDWLPETNIITGDANNWSDVALAAQDVDLLVYGANPAYHHWHEEALPMLETALQVAKKMSLRILFPGNVYNFAPSEALIDEACHMIPPTNLGEIRMRMEQRLKKASEQGARVTIVRAGDFLGPKMRSSWLDHMLKTKRGHYTIAMPHDVGHTHFWSYLPDFCANAALLIEAPESNFDVWHDAGLTLKTKDWQQAFADKHIQLDVKSFPWWFFKIAAPFSPLLREVFKMRYLWRNRVILDASKMKKKLGNKRKKTPIEVIFSEIIS